MKRPLILTPNVKIEHVLLWAAHDNRVAVVEQLLRDPSIDCNATDAHGVTPFYAAVYRGHSDLVKLMISNPRVDVNKPCSGCNDATPYWIACHRGHKEIIKLLETRVDKRPNKYGILPKG